MIFFDSEYFHGVKECEEERITCVLDFIPKNVGPLTYSEKAS